MQGQLKSRVAKGNQLLVEVEIHSLLRKGMQVNQFTMKALSRLHFKNLETSPSWGTSLSEYKFSA